MAKFKILEHSAANGFPADGLVMAKVATSTFFAEKDALLGVRNLLKWEFSFNVGNHRILSLLPWRIEVAKLPRAQPRSYFEFFLVFLAVNEPIGPVSCD